MSEALLLSPINGIRRKFSKGQVAKKSWEVNAPITYIKWVELKFKLPPSEDYEADRFRALALRQSSGEGLTLETSVQFQNFSIYTNYFSFTNLTPIFSKKKSNASLSVSNYNLLLKIIVCEYRSFSFHLKMRKRFHKLRLIKVLQKWSCLAAGACDTDALRFFCFLSYRMNSKCFQRQKNKNRNSSRTRENTTLRCAITAL